jgi:hypothetical protein
MNESAMCLFDLSLTDEVSQMAGYNGISIDLPDKDAAKVWKNLFKHFYSNNTNKMNESESEFVKRTLYSYNTNPDEWCAEI